MMMKKDTLCDENRGYSYGTMKKTNSCDGLWIYALINSVYMKARVSHMFIDTKAQVNEEKKVQTLMILKKTLK